MHRLEVSCAVRHIDNIYIYIVRRQRVKDVFSKSAWSIASDNWIIGTMNWTICTIVFACCVFFNYCFRHHCRCRCCLNMSVTTFYKHLANCAPDSSVGNVCQTSRTFPKSCRGRVSKAEPRKSGAPTYKCPCIACQQYRQPSYLFGGDFKYCECVICLLQSHTRT